ncbi:replication initiation protein [Bifidobacterium longum]|nr:replication initiation protein [Bifidobacterium longum]MDL5543733.1 replication initiation protein [Bifidobacterium longum]
MSTELREQWEQLYLPLRPLCTNDFIEGVYRQPRAKALEGYRYIEANPKTVSDLLVVDIDDANARAMALWEHEGMLPNVIVENPRNGHAHAVWALAAPFSRTEYARRKPLALAAAVTEGLRRSCDGDKGYSGLMTKNPLH